MECFLKKPPLNMAPMLLLLILLNLSLIDCNKTANFWLESGKMLRLLLHNCPVDHTNIDGLKEVLSILQGCLKYKTLLILDRSLNRDIIELTAGIELVKYYQFNDNNTNSNRDLKLNRNDWTAQILKRIRKLFNTHVLRIHFIQNDVEARHRRRRGVMSMITFGVIALGAILIWIGFQFLAVLGGKALLLAKMALLLTSIQGLKKIATSNLNYGLYSTYPQNYWNYDRQWPYDVEGHESRMPFYYELPEQQTDLTPPIHPRIHSIRNKFDE